MKFNYKLRRVCGPAYGYPVTSATAGSSAAAATQWSGSNIVFVTGGNSNNDQKGSRQSSDSMIAAVGNRIQVTDIQHVTVRTLPVEGRSNIAVLAYSSPWLLAIDVQNRALWIHLFRGIVVHRSTFPHRVRCAAFAPCASAGSVSRLVAVGTGTHVQIWSSPYQQQHGDHHAFAPLQLVRTYTGLTDDVTCLIWSSDASVLVAASRDGSSRVWTTTTVHNYTPVTLAGHKTPVLGLFFAQDLNKPLMTESSLVCSMYTVSADGAVVTWQCQRPSPSSVDDSSVRENMNDADMAHQLVGSSWSVQHRHYLHQEGGASVTATSMEQNILAVGFSTGLVGLYEMPGLTNLHTLSVGSASSSSTTTTSFNHHLVKACTLNPTGDWLALACPVSQMLAVWEWQSETYVLRQRGHASGGMSCMAYALDSVVVATGGLDGTLKLWNASTGLCYVTFTDPASQHTAVITKVAFANASVVVTASLDGTVKLHDLHRYRTFRTLTTPTPVQFTSMAVDSAGEIVVAGNNAEPFCIYAWNVQTGKLLDMLSGHAGPIYDLTFQHGTGILCSASWDGTVKTWDLYKNTGVATDSFQHLTDVVCVAISPDGKQVCSGTIGGLLSFWNVESSKLLFEIDGRLDIVGGRKWNDRMTADNNAASRYFTSVCYSADGSCILAGGNSKFVCIYEVSQQILIKKFQISFNRSLDGILDELNSKNLGDGGPIDEEAESGDETTYNAMNLPGARRGDDGSRTSRVEVLTLQVSFSPTGREWAVVTGEGLHIYSLDDDMIFDPISLTEAITPAAVEAKLAASEFGLALRMAIHLNEFALIKNVLECTSYKSIPGVVQTVGPEQLERLLQVVGTVLDDSPHVEFFLQWCLEILQTHGKYMDRNRASFMRVFRSLHKAVSTKHGEVKTICNENKYTLDFIEDHARMLLLQNQNEDTVNRVIDSA